MDKKQTLNPDWLEKYARRVIEHMNEDHQNTIVSTLNAQLKIEDPLFLAEHLMLKQLYFGDPHSYAQ